LATPMVLVASNDSVMCRITNITPSPVPVQVQLIGAVTGSVVLDTGTITLPPGQTTETYLASVGSLVYCRFVHASKSKVRAALAVFAATGSDSYRLVVEAPMPLATDWQQHCPWAARGARRPTCKNGDGPHQ
jgi:hypothetical protein